MSAGQSAGMVAMFFNGTPGGPPRVNGFVISNNGEAQPFFPESNAPQEDNFNPQAFGSLPCVPGGFPYNRYQGPDGNFRDNSGMDDYRQMNTGMQAMMDTMMNMMLMMMLMQMMTRLMQRQPNPYGNLPGMGMEAPGGSKMNPGGGFWPGILGNRTLPGNMPPEGGNFQGGGADFEKALKKVLKYEGGLSNDAYDHGGLTNKGITQGEYTSFLQKHGQASRSVAGITQSEVRRIYYEDYWKASGADKMSGPASMAVFDTAVNMGVGTAKKMYRQANGDLGSFFNLRRQRYYQIASHGHQSKFLKGWLSRLDDLQKTAYA